MEKIESESRKVEKKRLIMEKALELFAEQGFSSTSIQGITERAGMSKGAFYLSFKSKDELILALIHQFFQEFIADIDHLVSDNDSEQLLYHFYYNHFERFSNQSDFAKVFMKEQTHFLNEDFFAQIIGYNEIIQGSILSMLEKVYGDKVAITKYDMVYAIQGLMRSYMELLLFSNLPFDLKQLAQSLVEKTDVLANHMSLPVITADSYSLLREPIKTAISEEMLKKVIDETISLLEESVEKESLLLLKDEMSTPSLSRAVISGLLKNIENEPNCKRASYLLNIYFNENN